MTTFDTPPLRNSSFPYHSYFGIISVLDLSVQSSMSSPAAFLTSVPLVKHAGQPQTNSCLRRVLVPTAPLVKPSGDLKQRTVGKLANRVVMIRSDSHVTSQQTVFQQPSIVSNSIGAPAHQEIDSTPVSQSFSDVERDLRRQDVIVNYERFLNSPEASDVDVGRPVFISNSGALVCSYP